MENIIKVPTEIGTDEFYENSNNLSYNELKSLQEFLRQGVRALVSRTLSTIEPNSNQKQILECEITIESRDSFGMSSLEMPYIKKLIQYQDGIITATMDNGYEQDIDELDDDTLLAIARELS